MTTRYVILLRGINVGGRNKLPMARLKAWLEEKLGASDVTTVLQSGNVILTSSLGAKTLADKIEQGLSSAFKFDSKTIKVLVLPLPKLQAMVDDRPRGFGDAPETYHSDAIFMLDLGVDEAMTAFDPREGVDTIWPGKGVIYSQRLSAQRTKTRLNKMMASPLYLSMTMRSWGTVLKLLELARA